MARLSVDCSDDEFHRLIQVLEKLTNLPSSITDQDIARSEQYEQNLDNEDKAEPEEKSLTAFTNNPEMDFLQLKRQQRDTSPTSVRLPAELKDLLNNVASDCTQRRPDMREPSQSDVILGALNYFRRQYDQTKKSDNDDELERLLAYIGFSRAG